MYVVKPVSHSIVLLLKGKQVYVFVNWNMFCVVAVTVTVTTKWCALYRLSGLNLAQGTVRAKSRPGVALSSKALPKVHSQAVL